MVQGIGGNGSAGSIRDLSTYQVYYPMYQSYVRNRDSNLSFEAWLIKEGYIDNFTQKVENYVETGDATLSDGKNGNTLNSDRYLSNGTGAIFQTEDEDTFYEFDYDKGTYRKIQGTEEVAKALGLQNDKNVDTITLGYQKANITDYTFGNLEDGQDSKNYSVGGKYAGVSYTNQEFDVHYILNALLMDPTDPQYNIAKEIFDKLCSNTKQWLPASDEKALDEVAAEFGANSAEYKAKLQQVLLKNLDQADEWIEEHTHVKNVNGGLTPDSGKTDGTENGGTTGGAEDKKPPTYDQTNVLTTAGLSTAYARGDKRTAESTNNSEGNRRKELQEKMDADLNTIASALVSNLGDQMTPEIQTYINKAIAATVADASLIKTWSEKHGFLNMHKKTLGEYSIKQVADKFFQEFNTLCANNGKTSAEVEAEKKAAEEKKAKETAAYKNLYNTNMSSVAKEAGVGSNLQVVSPSSAADIQKKAESEILAPLKAKIREKMAGQGISDSDLNTILENSAKAALSDCTEWATTSNNYVYTIDTDLLVSKFESNVKTVIKNKGYEF